MRKKLYVSYSDETLLWGTPEEIVPLMISSFGVEGIQKDFSLISSSIPWKFSLHTRISNREQGTYRTCSIKLQKRKNVSHVEQSYFFCNIRIAYKTIYGEFGKFKIKILLFQEENPYRSILKIHLRGKHPEKDPLGDEMQSGFWIGCMENITACLKREDNILQLFQSENDFSSTKERNNR